MTVYDEGKSIVMVASVLVAPAYITLILRCYVRCTRKVWGLDDTCMVLSAPFFAWLSASCISAAANGIGWHEYRIKSAEQSTRALRDFFMIQISYCITVLLVKLSVVLMLLRITVNRPVYIWVLRCTMALFSFVIIGVGIYTLSECHPVRYAWDKSIEGGHCLPVNIITTLTFTLAAVNIVTVWVCALLPIPLLWTVRLNINTKIAAGVLLGFGIFASVCALVRLKYTINLTSIHDYFYHVAPVIVWAFAEVGVAMIAANGSTLRPLVAGILSLDGSAAETNKRHTSGWAATRLARTGDIELDESKDTYVHTTVEGGMTKRTESQSSMGDDESSRDMLRSGKDLGGIHVRYDVESHQDSMV